MIITQNEHNNIRECLESVRWADEIVVVDAESSDDTRSICAEYTDRIFVRPWSGFAAQKEFALNQCRSDWVLSLDADERVRPDLREEIQGLLTGTPKEDGYRVARRSYFLGRWIRHCGWYPGYQVRLFRRNRVRMIKSRVHEGFEVQGPMGTLEYDLDHFSHPTLFSSIQKLNRYTSLEALDRLDRRQVHAIDFLTHPLAEFLKKYIRLQGFRDGSHGYLLSWISALVKMVLYMKIWHLQHLPQDRIEELKRNTL
jgi:glycosyltransferase involved in cell wall biosynthesis